MGLGSWMGVSGFAQFPSHRNIVHVKELPCPFPRLKKKMLVLGQSNFLPCRRQQREGRGTFPKGILGYQREGGLVRCKGHL